MTNLLRQRQDQLDPGVQPFSNDFMLDCELVEVNTEDNASFPLGATEEPRRFVSFILAVG